MKTCNECANFECQNFFGVGKCTKEGMLAYFEDEACEDFVELPDDVRMQADHDGTGLPGVGRTGS